MADDNLTILLREIRQGYAEGMRAAEAEGQLTEEGIRMILDVSTDYWKAVALQMQNA